MCGECEARMPVSITVNDFVLKHTPGHTNKIQLDSNFHVVMKYPTFQHYTKLYLDENGDDNVYDVLAECIDTIYSEDEVFVNTGDNYRDFREFVENLTVPQFEKLENFFVTMPILEKIIEYECVQCTRKNIVSIDGITNFFG
jgi:hypothetical protein